MFSKLWDWIATKRYAASAVHNTNFEYDVAKMFQRASKEFGVETFIGPSKGSFESWNIVGLYYPNEDEEKRAHEEPLQSHVNKRFYELQRNPIRMLSH